MKIKIGDNTAGLFGFAKIMKEVSPFFYWGWVAWLVLFVVSGLGSLGGDPNSMASGILLIVSALVMFKPSIWWVNRKVIKYGYMGQKVRGKTEQRLREICDGMGLVERARDGSSVFPAFSIHADGDLEIILPTSIHISKVDRPEFLAACSQVFQVDYQNVESFGQTSNKVLLSPSRLPEKVIYGVRNRPAVNGFWLGTDSKGDPVVLDWGHSPVALITGASGSGKSVLGRVMVEEAFRAGWSVVLSDGKGGLDWGDIDGLLLKTEFSEIALVYQQAVALMNNRLEQLRNAGAKNWREFVAKGGEMEPMLLFMDEASDFFTVGSAKQDPNYDDKHEIIKAAGELARKSRAVGIFQAVSLQAAKAESVPDDIRNNAAFRISYALPSAAMSQTLFESPIAFDESLRMGKGVFRGLDKPVVFRGAYIDEKYDPYEVDDQEVMA